MSLVALTAGARQRFLELLPWYVNGTLGTNDRHEVVRWLAKSAECRTELYELMSLAKRIRNQPLQGDPHAGLDRLMAMVHMHDAGKLLRLAPKPRAARLVGHRPARWYRPALAVAAAIAILQTGVVLMNMYEVVDGGVLRPLVATQLPIRHGTIQTTFHNTANELQIRALLALVGAEIVSGPDALGVYTLKIPSERSKAALKELQRATGIVDSATLMNH